MAEEAADPLARPRAALLPTEGLAALAPVRRETGIRVIRSGGRAWVEWDGARPAVAACLLAVPGVILYEPAVGRWHRLGSRLPDFDMPPAGPALPLDRMLVPASVTALPAPESPIEPVAVTLVRGGVAGPATAWRGPARALAAWADRAPTAELAAVRAAWREGVVLLVGPVPPVPEGERFRGDDLLVPLGLRPEPDWPTAALRAAFGIGSDELAILTGRGVEAVPRAALQPATRAGLRLALRGE
jgi:hypothetical protein